MLINNVETIGPIVYTPVVGDACEMFKLLGELDRNTEGKHAICIDATDVNAGNLEEKLAEIREIIKAYPKRNVTSIVVTDGGRILGLGDIGGNRDFRNLALTLVTSTTIAVIVGVILLIIRS